MIRSSIFLCLLSVAFAHPYVSSSYYNSWPATNDQLSEIESSRPYMQSASLDDDEGSFRQVRAVEYPVELENSPAIPQVAFIELDENALRTARSLISDQPINSNARYECDSDNQIFRNDARFNAQAQVPDVSRVYFNSPRQDEHSTQSYKSFSYDNLPFVSSMTSSKPNPVANSQSPFVDEDSAPEFKQSTGNLNDYVKELIDQPSSAKSTSDTKRPRMFGFYYMNIQRFPVKQQVIDDSVVDPKPSHHQSTDEVRLNSAQANNEDEILQLLQKMLQQQISKFVQHQQQEHTLYQEFAQPPQTIKQTTQQEYSTSTEKLDHLGNEEKKFIIERLRQEERWLQDSLKHVRNFLNQMRTESVSGISTTATPEVVTGNLSNANNDVIDRSSTTTTTEPSTVSTVESISDAFNVASSGSKDTSETA